LRRWLFVKDLRITFLHGIAWLHAFEMSEDRIPSNATLALLRENPVQLKC